MSIEQGTAAPLDVAPATRLGMTAPQLRFVLIEQGLGAAVVNFVIDGAIGWLLFRGVDPVPFWGDPSIAADTIGTSFILAFLTTMIVTTLARSRVRGGVLTTITAARLRPRLLASLPRNTFLRALVLGATCAATAAPLMLLVLHLVGVDAMPHGAFLLFNASYAAVLGGLVTPLVAVAALAER
jgi:hypothetical protein